MKVQLYDRFLMKKFTLPQTGVLTIGRCPELSDLVVPNNEGLARGVSKAHCSLLQVGNDLIVRDSGNGGKTYVDGVEVTSVRGTLLSDGSNLRLGDYEFHVQVKPEFRRNPKQIFRTLYGRDCKTTEVLN